MKMNRSIRAFKAFKLLELEVPTICLVRVQGASRDAGRDVRKKSLHVTDAPRYEPRHGMLSASEGQPITLEHVTIITWTTFSTPTVRAYITSKNTK
jgi:hypothetical protein